MAHRRDRHAALLAGPHRHRHRGALWIAGRRERLGDRDRGWMAGERWALGVRPGRLGSRGVRLPPLGDERRARRTRRRRATHRLGRVERRLDRSARPLGGAHERRARRPDDLRADDGHDPEGWRGDRLSLTSLDVEWARADAIDPHDDGDSLLVLVHVLFDLSHVTPYPLADLRIGDDLRGAVKAERAPIARRITNEDRDARVRADRVVRLALGAFPPGEMVFVPDHQAALQREVRLTVVRRRHEPGRERLLVLRARVVDDVGERSQVDRGDWRDRWTRRSGRHLADRNTAASRTISVCPYPQTRSASPSFGSSSRRRTTSTTSSISRRSRTRRTT